MKDPKIKRVLISVTDKSGVADFAGELESEFGVTVVSTGGTARALSEAGVDVVPIEKVTGFPEMMDGRVKTLNPMVHGGILARRDKPEHMAEARAHGIEMIDMVVVNLYEFQKTVESGASFSDCVEHIDIGGPTLLRASAKNFAAVTVVSDPADYREVLEQMREHDGATTRDLRQRLALKAFKTTAAYDTAISEWMESQLA